MKYEAAQQTAQKRIDAAVAEIKKIDLRIVRLRQDLDNAEAERAVHAEIRNEWVGTLDLLKANDEDRDVHRHTFDGSTGHGDCAAMVMRNGGGDQCGLPKEHRLHLGNDSRFADAA